MKPLQLCRCCLSEHCYKDISSEYYHSGRREVYSEMLNDTFNLCISYQGDLGRICEDCIRKLRSATEFRKQIVIAEAALLKSFNIGVDTGTSFLQDGDINKDCKDQVTIKTDEDIGDQIDQNDDTGWQCDDIGGVESEMIDIKLEPEEEIPEVNLRRNTRSTVSKPVKVKKETTTERNSDVKKQNKGFNRKNNASKMTGPTVKKPSFSKVSTRIKSSISQTQTDMKQNSIKLITNSNLCIFDSLKIKFRCFYCKTSYLDIKDLKEHAKIHTNEKYLKLCISRLKGVSYKNVEISNLSCKICTDPIKDLIELRKHLTDKHGVEFTNDEHFLIPYRLEKGFNCASCDETFKTFYRLSIHMNKHYAYNVCEICGGSFVNRLSLRTHVQSLHKEKKCTVCQTTFHNNYARTKHMRKMHDTKESVRYCLQCDKTFQYTYMLDEHKIREHGAKRQICTCSVCGKTFGTANNLKVHVRCVHMKERNYPCSYCEMRFFTKCDQKRHERTHADIRSFSCSYCEGKFKSKDSLRRHLKRQHKHLSGVNNEPLNALIK